MKYAPPRTGWVADDLYDDQHGLMPDISVPEHKPVDTGLLYPSGEPIMRLPNPMGFGRDGEW